MIDPCALEKSNNSKVLCSKNPTTDIYVSPLLISAPLLISMGWLILRFPMTIVSFLCVYSLSSNLDSSP